MQFLRQNTAVTIMFGPFVDKTDGVTLKTDATTITDIDHASTGIFLSKAGGAGAIRHATVTASVADAYGMMKVTLDTTDVNTLGQIDVLFAKAATYLPVHKSFMVLNTALFDSLCAGSGAAIPNLVAGAAGGVFIAGTNAPVTITGSGNALTITSTAADGNAISLTGNGAGNGIKALGGSGGDGILAQCGAAGQAGINAYGGASDGASGIYAHGGANAAPGIRAQGGTTGNGIDSRSGATSGHGVYAASGTGTGNGVHAVGGGTSGRGIYAQALNLGAGIEAVGGGTSGDGIKAYAVTSGHGLDVIGEGNTYCGLRAASGTSATGSGIKAESSATNGSGMTLIKTGTGSDLNATVTPLVLAKTTNITGLNDIAATAIVSSGAITTSGGAVTTVTGVTNGVTLAASQHVIVDSGTVTTLTNLPAIPANWITASGITAAALNGKGDWNTTVPPAAAAIGAAVWDLSRTGHATSGTFGQGVASVIGNIGGNITGNVEGNLEGSISDKSGYALSAGGVTAAAAGVWATAARTLTAGTNIVLAKGVGVTGFNDIDAAGVRGAVGLAAANLDAAIADLPTNAELATALGTADDAMLVQIALVKAVTDKVDTALVIDGAVYQLTANALALAPTGGSAPTAAAIADAVWDEALIGHAGAGSAGLALSGASAPSAATVASAVRTELSAELARVDVATSTRSTYAGGPVASVTADVGITQAGADKVWSSAARTLTNFGSLVADSASAVWAAATRVLTAGTNIVLTKGTGVTGLNDLDAAGVRAAVGLTSANLNTQLGDIPTNTELATALAAADDATLAQVALVKAKTDLIPAQPAAVGNIPSAAAVADAVWDEAMAGHAAPGSTGTTLAAAGLAGDPWIAVVPGGYAPGTAGYVLGTPSAGSAGAGAIEWTYTLTEAGSGAPIADADVWITTDAAGANVIASGRTDQSGAVVFFLDAGPVYVFRQKSGWNFANPDLETVTL